MSDLVPKSPPVQELEYRLALWSNKLRQQPELRTRIPSAQLSELLTECRSQVVQPQKPQLRSLHHFACSGGTLISKCLSAMPGAWLLSEIDPLSEIPSLQNFTPTDLISLLRSSAFGAEPEVLIEVFLGGLAALVGEASHMARDLILRDHAHSHFCHPADLLERPSIRDILQRQYDLHSLVTVRHPLDSFLSIAVHRSWATFEPQTVAEYCRRYTVFLERYADCPTLRYEDLTHNPEAWMQQACTHLDLGYNPDFQMIFPAIKLSGDSGRSGGVIAARPRLAIPDDIRTQLTDNSSYEALCARLGYDPDPTSEVAPT